MQLARYYLAGAAELCGDHSVYTGDVAAIDDAGVDEDIGFGSSTASFDG